MKKTKFILILICCVIINCGSIVFVNVFAEDANALKRSQVDEKYKWKLSDIYIDTNDWNKDFSNVQKSIIPKIQGYSKDITNPKKLAECLKLIDSTYKMLDKLYLYASLSEEQDESNSTATEMKSKAEKLSMRLSLADADIEFGLSDLSDSQLKKLQSDKDLAEYKDYIDNSVNDKKNKTTKSQKQSMLNIQYIGNMMETTYSKLAYSDLKISYDTYEDYFKSFDSFKDTFAANLSAKVTSDVLLSQQLGFKSSLEMSLYYDNMYKTSYDNLIKVVNNNLQYLQRYISLRKKLFNIDKFHIDDFSTPIVKEYPKNYTSINYEDAKKIVLDSLSVLGNSYKLDMQKGFDSQWVDVYATEDKADGGFTDAVEEVHPFVLINYDNTIGSVLTLSHEMGHALNLYYLEKNNKFSKDLPFNGEVSSTVNEMLTLRYLLSKASDDNEKLYLLDKLAQNIVSEMYDCTLYSEFEEKIHNIVENDDALSSDVMGNLWGELLSKYYGKDYDVNQYEKSGWALVPHFYYNFYNYKYAMSIAIANKISRDIMSGKANEISNYAKLLNTSDFEDYYNMLYKMGIDGGSTSSIRDVLTDFNSIIDQMEAIINKQNK